MNFQEHVQRSDNPHRLTKEKLGLSNIESFPLATEEEIKALARNDRYIDKSQLQLVRKAFTQYLEDLNLLDENGNLIGSPDRLTGDVRFEIRNDTLGLLEGTNPQASKVEATITINGVAQPVLTTTTFSSEGFWSINTTSITYPTNSLIDVDISIYDALDRVRQKGTATGVDLRPGQVADVNNTNIFPIDVYGVGHIEGVDPNTIRIDYIVYEDGIEITQGSIDEFASDGAWSRTLSGITFDRYKDYSVKLSHFDQYTNLERQGTLVARDERNRIDLVGDMSLNWDSDLNTISGNTVDASKVLIEVEQNDTVVYTGEEAVSETSGDWTHTVVGVTLQEGYNVYVYALDPTDELVKRDAIELGVDENQGGSYYTANGVDWYDQQRFTSWAEVPTPYTWLDQGSVTRQPGYIDPDINNPGSLYTEDGVEWYDHEYINDWASTPQPYTWIDPGKIVDQPGYDDGSTVDGPGVTYTADGVDWYDHKMISDWDEITQIQWLDLGKVNQ